MITQYTPLFEDVLFLIGLTGLTSGLTGLSTGLTSGLTGLTGLSTGLTGWLTLFFSLVYSTRGNEIQMESRRFWVEIKYGST